MHPSSVAHQKPRSGVFSVPNLPCKLIGSLGGLSNAFSRLMDRTGIHQPSTSAAGRTGKGRTFRALSFHSFRHAFISRLANADVRKSLAGHSSDEVHRRYVHLDVSTQRRAIDGLPSLGV